VDVVTTPALSEALQPWRRRGQRLILDLRSVEYIESPGLRLLIALGDELLPSGGQIRLVVEPGSRVERTLGLVGLNQRFPIFHSAREAWEGRQEEELVGGTA
jgi:anti-anti-sigma factor